jgi:TRAP-type C4-dicarboxylate transport system permease small subunit
MAVVVHMKTLRDALIWVAGGALLVAMVVDTLAMFGRSLHWPLLGAIELVQAAVLFGSAGALLLATLEHAHARVHLLLDRLPPGWQLLLSRLHALFALLLYAGLLVGAAWIMLDLWNGHEESELLRIPYRPLRLALVLVLVLLLLDSARRIVRRARA